MSDEDKVNLPLGVPHPAAVSAYQFINELPLVELVMWQEIFASITLSSEDNLLASTCSDTLDRIIKGETIGDRYILGLAWTVKNMIEND